MVDISNGYRVALVEDDRDPTEDGLDLTSIGLCKSSFRIEHRLFALYRDLQYTPFYSS